MVTSKFTTNGRWRIENDRVAIIWGDNQNWWENLAIESPDRMAGDSWNSGRNSVVFTRLQQPPVQPTR